MIDAFENVTLSSMKLLSMSNKLIYIKDRPRVLKVLFKTMIWHCLHGMDRPRAGIRSLEKPYCQYSQKNTERRRKSLQINVWLLERSVKTIMIYFQSQ